MKKLCMVFMIIAAGVLASGCIQSEPMQVTETVAPTTIIPTTAPVVTVPTTQVPSWSWEYTPPETPAPTSKPTPKPTPSVSYLPKMAGHVYCYAGAKLGGCVGFNVSTRDYLETITDVSGEMGYMEVFGDDTMAKYGTWTKVSSTKVVVETTYSMTDHFAGKYDDSTSWECYDSACTLVYESKYGLNYVLMEDTFV